MTFSDSTVSDDAPEELPLEIGPILDAAFKPILDSDSLAEAADSFRSASPDGRRVSIRAPIHVISTSTDNTSGLLAQSRLRQIITYLRVAIALFRRERRSKRLFQFAAVTLVTVLFAFALAVRLGTQSDAAEPTGTTLLRVIDGDTLVVSGNAGSDEHVRLLAIDTPERGERWHAEAGRALRKAVSAGSLRLEFEVVGRLDRDRYGRILAYVYVDDRNVNVEMVRNGWSEYITRYGHSRYANDFVEAEGEARSARRGIWSTD